MRGGALVAALVDDGLPEDALVGFFVSEGGVKHAGDAEFSAADSALVRLITRAIADSLCALPLRRSGDAVLVAFADPTDAHAQAELARALGAEVIPATVRLSSLRTAIRRVFARIDEENASIDVDLDMQELFDEEDAPVELVRRRSSPQPSDAPPRDTAPRNATPLDTLLRATAQNEPERATSQNVGSAGAMSDSGALPNDDELHVPLVRTKPVAAPPSAGADTPFSRERTRTQDMLLVPADPSTSVLREPPAPLPSKTPTLAPPPARPVVRPGVAPAPEDDLLSGDRWSTLPAETARQRSDPAPLLTPPSKPPPATRRRFAPVSGAPPAGSLPDVGPVLAAIRGAASRDEAVRLACEGALPACRSVVFLALKRDVLQGRDAVGGGVSREAIYNLWIPVTSASVFREAITSGTAHFGAYGTTAADGIYKAAIGSIGGDALVQPVIVAGKPVAVLCGDDLRYGSRGRQRVEALALALGDAFERLIVSKKK